jgi:hypothetical protein
LSAAAENPGSAKDTAPFTHSTVALLCACVVIGGVLRIAGARGDLWLDEVYSILAVRDLASALPIFTDLAQDNNHHLNSLWIHWFGDPEHRISYRLFSLATGTAAIALAPLATGRRGFWNAGVSGLLVATSFPLITYSSEARGYAPMLFFALASLALMRRALPDGDLRTSAASGVAAVLAFLSHSAFVHFYLAMALWSLWNVARRGPPRRRGAAILLRLHLLPSVFFACFYAVSLRGMYVAGGPERSLFEILAEVSALSLGVPHMGSLAEPAIAVVAVLAVVGLVALWRTGSDLWVFHLGAMLIAPGALLLLRPPEVLFARYFLVATVAFLLLLAALLGGAIERGGLRRAAAAIALLVVCAGNGVEIARFLAAGRGHYLGALEAIADATKGPVVRVGSDHPFRNGNLIFFYEPYLASGKRFEYVDTEAWKASSAPEWYLRQDRSLHPEPDAHLVFFQRDVYELVDQHPYYGLSGWHWLVYRHKGRLGPRAGAVLPQRPPRQGRRPKEPRQRESPPN